jgi:uncharacterized RDD family membrane protein YckC
MVVPVPATTRRPASLGRRAGAVMIDGVLVWVGWAVVALAVDLLLGYSIVRDSIRWLWLITAIYEITLIAWLGQTIGKRWLAVAVVDDRGHPPSL